jgi:hypothetical protein
MIGACGVGDSGTVPVAPDDPSTINVVVLFDRSGSTDKNGSRLGIERAIWPATFFPNLGRSYSLNVMPIGFSTDAEAWCEWPDSTDKERVLSQSTKCKSEIENLVDRPVGGNTHFDAALKAAAERLDDVSGRKYVLLVTDGEYTHAGGKKIKCDDGSQACEDLGSALDGLNKNRTTVCSIFVSTPFSNKEESTETLEWLRDRQNQNDSKNPDWAQSGCPASTEIDLKGEPWRLAEDIIIWYSEELAGLHVRTSDTDVRGNTKVPAVVPNGAAQIAIIGLKGSRDESVSFKSAECEVGAGTTFESFYFQPVTSELSNGERCPEGRIAGEGLAPNENSLLALFVPEKQELAACIPNTDGGGQLQLRPGFNALLGFNPRAVWVGPDGEKYDPNLSPEQYRDGSLFLNESQASDLQSREGWMIAFDYEASVNSPGKLEEYSLLYESTVIKTETSGGYAARAPISPTIDNLPCAKLFERNPWQRYWLLFLGVAALLALAVMRAIYKSQSVDLAGEIQVLNSAGTQTISRHTISGGSPSWFNVGERLKMEPGKLTEGSNWRLVWKKGAALEIQQEAGSTEEWSIGTPKMERGQGVVEFRRVPLGGSSEVHTVRYIPEGGKVGDAIEKVLEEEGS